MFPYFVHNATLLYRTLSQFNSINFKIVAISPSTARSHKWSLLFRLSDKNFCMRL